MQESVDLMRKAAELDPRSAIIGANLADVYARQGSYSRAEHQYKKAIDIHPGFPRGYQGLALFYAFYVGRFDLAIQNAKIALTMDPDSLNDLWNLVDSSLELGDLEAARRYRQKQANINDEDWRLGVSDMLINLRTGNARGVRDAWRWMKPRLPVSTIVIPSVALLVLANGDTLESREIYTERDPGWMNPEEWERLVDRDPTSACLVAWTLTQSTGNRIARPDPRFHGRIARLC